MHKVLTGSVLTLGTRIVTFVFNMGTIIIISRILGPSDYGIYSLLILIPTLLITVGTPAIGLSNVYLSGRGEHDINKIAGNSITGAAIFSFTLLISILLTSRIPLFWDFLVSKSITPQIFWVTLLAIPFMLIFFYFTSIIRGTGRILEFNLTNTLVVIIHLLVVVILTLARVSNLLGYIIGFVVYYFIASIVAFYFLSRFAKIDLSGDRGLFKSVVKYGTKAYLWNLITFMDRRLDLIIVGILLTSTEIGYYSNAIGLVEKMWFLPESIAVVLFPFVASSNDGDSRKLVPITSRNTFMLMFVSSLIVGVFAKPIIVTLFGVDYLPAVNLLRLLLPGTIFFSVARLITVAYAGMGKPEMGAITAFISLSLMVGLIFVLFPIWGVNGVAIAATVGYSFAALIIVFTYSRQMQVPLHSLLIINSSDIKQYIAFLRKGKTLFQRKPILS
jgi:O-antigen/teichoic acid export membrane protein